jgi:hypothetical protein
VRPTVPDLLAGLEMHQVVAKPIQGFPTYPPVMMQTTSFISLTQFHESVFANHLKPLQRCFVPDDRVRDNGA